MRVVLVSQYFPPEVGATQFRMQSFAEHLSQKGHDVCVICEFPNHPHGVIPPEYRGRLIEDDRSEQYRILRVWVKANSEKTQRTRLTFYLSFMAMATAVTPLIRGADVVLATSPPLFAAAAGLAVAKLRRVPFVLDVRDLWPAAATSLNQISPGLVTEAAETLERFLYRRADAVTAVTRPFCEHVDAVRGAGARRTALIPNGTLDLFFQDADGGADRRRYGLPDDAFVVTFAGMLGIAQALPTVLHAASRVDHDVAFALVGDGPVRSILEEQAREQALSNVYFLGQQPLPQMPDILASSDVLLVTLSAHPTFTEFLPSKLIDYMATGKPIVVAAAGEATNTLERVGAGIAVPPEDPEALANAIVWLREHPAEAAEMGRRGRDYARRRLRSQQSERLEQLLIDVVGG